MFTGCIGVGDGTKQCPVDMGQWKDYESESSHTDKHTVIPIL